MGTCGLLDYHQIIPRFGAKRIGVPFLKDLVLLLALLPPVEMDLKKVLELTVSPGRIFCITFQKLVAEIQAFFQLDFSSFFTYHSVRQYMMYTLTSDISPRVAQPSENV